MATTPLLTTKLYTPQPRPDLQSRPRLVGRLDEGLRPGQRLTLISAPAGYGKTTLLSEWAQALGGAFPPRAIAWLSLDEGDNDPVRFWTYLVAALQRVDADLGHGIPDALRSPQRPPIEPLLTPLINHITAHADPLVLILDDYHLISTPRIHEGVAFLLEHQPPNLHLVISTRADPPLPLFRLRARGQLTELRSGDLRFTADEAAAFLNATMGLDLATKDVEALEARTEGWIVGLQLAALSLQDRADASEFIAAFGGTHHYVLEYLIEEVVRRRPEPVQRFLMETSVLERLCGPLCDALTGESDGDAMLAHLHQRNLFITPLDEERRWYRYHHLLADLLQNLLRKERPPEEIRALHRRASDWYEQRGMTAEAVSHALAVRDFDRVAQLIERHSLAMVTRGELSTLLRWIDALPEELAQSRPWLCVHQAWPLTFAGKRAAVEPLLQQIERQMSPDDPAPEHKEILGNVAAMRAMLATMHGDMRQAVEMAHQADELLPAGNLGPRSVISFAFANAYYAEGNLAKADQALTEKLETGRASDNLWILVRSLCDLADLRVIQGRRREAVDLVQEALQQAEQRGARQFGTVGHVLVKLGELLHERNDLMAATGHVLEGVDLMQGWQQPYELVSGYTVLAAIRQVQNDAQGAMEALQNAEEIRQRHPDYYKLNHLVRLCRIRLCLGQRGAEEAARQAQEARLGETGPLIYRERERIALAYVLVAQEEWDEALHLLAQLAEAAETGGRFGRLIEILVLQAVALREQGDTARALTALEKALTIGEPEGYVRVFVEHGEPMARLLRQAAARGIAPDYVRRLLVALGAKAEDTPSPPPARDASPLVEPLTGRETEVLHLLGEGYSNRQIAEELFITLNTVKKHTSNIYGKLGVRSRTQAVVRAQELGLL
jgi:LuxR family maltose regulon positive regulatory protein